MRFIGRAKMATLSLYNRTSLPLKIDDPVMLPAARIDLVAKMNCRCVVNYNVRLGLTTACRCVFMAGITTEF